MNDYSISEGNLQQNNLYGKFRLWIYASPITQNTLCLVASWLGIWAGMWLMNYIIVWKHFDFTQFTICGFLAGLIGLSFWFTIEFFLVLKYKFSILKSTNVTQLDSTNQYRSIRTADEVKADARRTIDSHTINFDKLTGRREVSPIEIPLVEPSYIPAFIQTETEEFPYGKVELIQDDVQFLFRVPSTKEKNPMPVSWEIQRKRYAAADSEWQAKPSEATTLRYKRERNFFVQCRSLRNAEEIRRAAVKQKLDLARPIQACFKSVKSDDGISYPYRVTGTKNHVLTYIELFLNACETRIGLPDPTAFSVKVDALQYDTSEMLRIQQGCIYSVNQA